MTVQNKIGKAVYVADGITTSFTIPFYFFDHQVAVYKGITNTPLSEGTDYTLTGAGNPSGGAVEFVTAPTNGEVITIMRNVDLTQLIKFMEGEKFPATDYEHSLDKITMALQQLSAYLDNCITIPAGAVLSPDDIYQFIVRVNNHMQEILNIPDIAEDIEEIYQTLQTVLNQYYTKTEIENAYYSKNDVYNKSEVDNMRPIKQTNITVSTSSIVADETYAKYPYKVDIAITGATADKLPQVILGAEDASSGIFAPIALSYNGGVRLYLKEIPIAASIEIPAILLH